tara:strand:+ start:163 stop:741 length:579 start_codon:yes stop_codon:yes gene_type:complete
MSLQEIIKKKGYSIAIWKETETLKELLNLNTDIKAYNIASNKRKKEYITVRLLLKNVLPNAQISYNEYGGPELDQNKHISISHSKGLTAIMIADMPIGIDIEKISAKSLKISGKFILEKSHLPLTKEKTTLIWCCKEAIYKLHVTGKIDFKDILIDPFTIQNAGTIQAKFKDITYSLTYKRISNHFLVYVCK